MGTIFSLQVLISPHTTTDCTFLQRNFTGNSGLEVDEAYRLLLAAHERDVAVGTRGFDFMEAVIATFLLTGGRRNEVMGLAVEDIDFDEGFVYFRPNAYRPDLKTRTSTRRVPLWPQLRGILTQHIETHRPTALLFTNKLGKADGKHLVKLQNPLAFVVKKTGISKPVTPKVFRHTYVTMRLPLMAASRLRRGRWPER